MHNDKHKQTMIHAQWYTHNDTNIDTLTNTKKDHAHWKTQINAKKHEIVNYTIIKSYNDTWYNIHKYMLCVLDG